MIMLDKFEIARLLNARYDMYQAANYLKTGIDILSDMIEKLDERNQTETCKNSQPFSIAEVMEKILQAPISSIKVNDK